MLGHYLLTLTAEQEDQVLMRPFGEMFQPCLCMLVGEGCWGANPGEFARHDVPGATYENLIYRFGVVRVNTALRNRILTNRARRILQNAPASRETAGVGECRFGRGE